MNERRARSDAPHQKQNMKTIRNLMVLLAILTLSACANLEKNAYLTIGTTSVTVEAARSAFIDYANTGRVKQEAFDRVKAAYEKYQAAMAAAQKMVAAYKANPTPGPENLTAALQPASEAADALLALVQSYLDAPANAKLQAKIGK